MWVTVTCIVVRTSGNLMATNHCLVSESAVSQSVVCSIVYMQPLQDYRKWNITVSFNYYNFGSRSPSLLSHNEFLASVHLEATAVKSHSFSFCLNIMLISLHC